MGVYRQVRALYRDHVGPLVEQYIGAVLRPLLGLMREHDVQLYVRQVSNASIAPCIHLSYFLTNCHYR
jgi:hypothetical protein